MGFRTGAFATVWDVQPGAGNFTKVRLSVSKKGKDGNYEQDFSGFCTFIGTAHAKAEKLRVKDRIKLGDVDVSTTFDKERQKEYVNYKVFTFDAGDEVGSAPARVEANPTEGDVSADNQAPF